MPHESERRLRMSLFTVPDVSIGRAPLTPQNSQFDQRRLDYLEGMTRYLNNLFQDLEKRYSQEEALSRLQKSIAQLPYSELVEIDGTRTPAVNAIASARDRIAFNQERLKICFLDALGRRPMRASRAERPTDSLARGSAPATPGIAAVDHHWARHCGSARQPISRCWSGRCPSALARPYSAPMTLNSLLTNTWCGQLTAIMWTLYSPLLSSTTRLTVPPG